MLLVFIYYIITLTKKLFLTGILSNGADDFEDSEEVYEAIGALLHEVSQEKTENDVKNVCERLLSNFFFKLYIDFGSPCNESI